MIVRALASDYDGTLAADDRIGPEALEALERAHAAGLRLVLLTGRPFFELPTYRPSWIRPSVLKAIDVFLLARAQAADELASLGAALGELAEHRPRAVASLPDLPRGEFVLVQGRDAGPAEVVTFVPVPRETAHVRHLRKYADGAVMPPERRFYFRRPDGALVVTAGSLGSFRETVAALDAPVLAF